jgi:hypothetical protein
MGPTNGVRGEFDLENHNFFPKNDKCECTSLKQESFLRFG